MDPPTNSPATVLQAIQTINSKKRRHRSPPSSSFVYRDIFVWIFFLLFVPLVFFSIYYFSKITHHQAGRSDSESTLLSIDDTNYLSRSSPIETADAYLVGNELQEIRYSHEKRRPLMKVSLAKYRAFCNDGSYANYYLRLSESHSKDWLILVDGGFFCYNSATCQQRFVNSHNFTSSKNYKSYKYASGILSSAVSENKYWSDANIVNIPYCSSDLWIGAKNSSLCDSQNCTDFLFMGSQILDNVFTDLLDEYGMKDSRLVVAAGVSSGGIGILLHANRLKTKLDLAAPNARFKVIIDSAWLFELPYSHFCNNLHDSNACTINQIFNDAIKYWQAHLPSECRSMKNLWSCFFPYELIPSLKMPVFILQSLFDETLLLEEFRSVSNHQDFLKKTLQSTSVKLQATINSQKILQPHGYFVPSCTTHMMLTRDDFKQIKIGDLSLDEAIYCWANDSQGCTNRIESCQWPNCHSTCPIIMHPDSRGSAISPLEYFSYFGIVNYQVLARKLKVRVKNLKLFENYNQTMALIMKA